MVFVNMTMLSALVVDNLISKMITHAASKKEVNSHSVKVDNDRISCMFSISINL